MTEKFNDRYGEVLNSDQRQILAEYAFSSSTNDYEDLAEKLSVLKKRTMKNIRKFSEDCSNTTINEKIHKVKVMVESVDLDTVNDDSVSKFLLLSRLNDELEEKTIV